MTNDEMRAISGTVASDDPLAALFYLLMRDELPVGVLEDAITAIEDAAVNTPNMIYTNGWLAQYALNLSQRIRALGGNVPKSINAAQDQSGIQGISNET